MTSKSTIFTIFSIFIIFCTTSGQSYARRIESWKPDEALNKAKYDDLKIRLDKTLCVLRELDGKVKFTFKPILNGAGIARLMTEEDFYSFQHTGAIRSDVRMKVYLNKRFAVVFRGLVNTELVDDFYGVGLVAKIR